MLWVNMYMYMYTIRGDIIHCTGRDTKFSILIALMINLVVQETSHHFEFHHPVLAQCHALNEVLVATGIESAWEWKYRNESTCVHATQN